MADRKSLLSRFWPPTSSRRTSTTKTAATTTSTPSTKPSSQTSPSPTTAPPPRAAARQSTVKATSPPTPATPPRTESRKDDQPNSASSPETSKSSSPPPQSKDEPTIPSPSRATTRSPPSSKPASPSRLPAQSRSPPQPSSPSHAAPQARSTLASPSRVGYQTPQSPSTPKRASKPHSPSRVTSRSPKQVSSSSPKGKQPASPSKESTTPTETSSTSSQSLILASKENDPKPAASQQEPEMKKEVTTDSAEGQTQEGKIFEHGNATTPAEGNQSLYSSTVNGREELDAKPEETKDVKEVMQARNSETNEETKKEVDDLVTPTHTVEKAEIPSEADQIHREKPEAIDTKEISDQIHREKPEAIDTKEISATTTYDGKSAPPNGERVPLHKNIRADVSKFANQMSMGDPKGAITDRHVSVITLAGENRGASMQMESDSSKREGTVHIHRSYKINPDDTPEAITDGEENSEGKKSEDERSTDDELTEAYVNNNAQGINNSIVLNSSITEGSPGVHMVVNHLPKELIQSKDKTSCSETRKAEVNTSRAEKLTYQPTVRRRCLRGLLLETSDSDPENPEKPRRHGCRVGCQKEDRENNIDVL